MICSLCRMNRWTFLSALCCSILLLAAGIYHQTCASVQIVNFNYQRDSRDITATLQQDLYWLTDASSFDIEYLMQTHSPTTDPRYYGKLHIKVLRENGKFAGFVTYYQRDSYDGIVQFLSVNQNFRGKGYGRQLLSHAVKQLFSLGVIRVSLVTRTNNIRAQRVYQKLGFRETHSEGGFVDFTIKKGELKA